MSKPGVLVTAVPVSRDGPDQSYAYAIPYDAFAPKRVCVNVRGIHRLPDASMPDATNWKGFHDTFLFPLYAKVYEIRGDSNESPLSFLASAVAGLGGIRLDCEATKTDMVIRATVILHFREK